MQSFYVRLAGFTLYPFFFTFRGAFRESVDARLWTLGTTPPLCYKPFARVRTFISVLPRTFAASILLFFSNELFFFSSHFISSHLKPPLSINQLPRARVPSHNICTFIHTPRRKVTAFVDSHVSFCVIIALPFEPWRAPLLSSRPTPFHHSSHPHTFLRNFHTYKHIHTLTSLLFSPHPPGFTISSKCQTKRQIRSLTARPAAVDTDHV